MSSRNRFLLVWLLLNPIGFTLGSLHGATDNGFVPSVIPGYLGLILGDLIFGGMVGGMQYFIFRKTNFLPVSIAWVVATSIGFTLGARTGALLTFRLTEDWMVAGIIFGVFMGASIGLTTAFTLYDRNTPLRIFTWIIISVTAWVAGEWIAFASFFSIKTVPLVAIAIAGITGLGLTLLHHQTQASNLLQAEP